MSRVAVILENAPDCELDRTVIDVPKGEDTYETSHRIENAIANWTLSVGDIIRIVEVDA